MKKFFKILLWTLGAIALLIACTAGYFSVAGLPSFDPPQIQQLTVEPTPERIAQGGKIASMVCASCHTGDDGKLSGKLVGDIPKDFGTIYSKNITQDPEIGIGKWTDGEIYHFLRTGIRKDGSFAPAYMPKFPLMSDEDVKAIIAWLRSNAPAVQPSRREPPPTEPSLLTKILSRTILGPYELPKKPIPEPDTSNAVEWGKYMANNVYGCFSCHSADFKTNNDLDPEKSEGYYGGGNKLLNLEAQIVLSANITPDKETGIGNYTEAQFIETVKYGRNPDGTMVRYPMQPHAGMSDAEISAIFNFLQTVPPIKNKVK